MKKENIYNVPNPISLLRILLAPILIILIFQEAKLIWVVSLFIFAAFTDFADGFIARRYNQVTNFGRRIDMIADRVLMISVIIAIISYLTIHDLLSAQKIILMILIMSREVICIPFTIIAFFQKKRLIPHARFMGKLMTLMQCVAFPMIMLSWSLAVPVAIITCIIRIINAGYYVYDSLINPNNSFQKKMDKYYKNK